eukprot:5365116-Alexandrium_andersonii.AAC.1
MVFWVVDQCLTALTTHARAAARRPASTETPRKVSFDVRANGGPSSCHGKRHTHRGRWMR